MKNLTFISILALYFICFAVFALAAKPHKGTVKDSTYERAVNDTLDTVLWVHEQHKGKMTWQELFNEVAAKMKVRRTEPWQR